MSLLGREMDGMLEMYFFTLFIYGTKSISGMASSDFRGIGRCNSIWISP